jgi:iron complex transport system substrate-binding protein
MRTLTGINRIFMAIVLALLLCSACAPQPETPATEATRDANGQAIDALGRSLPLTDSPQRIVVAGKSALSVLEAIYLFPEAADRVVALVSGRQSPGDFLRLVDATFDDKELLEIEAGPEQIAPFAPDIVLTRSFMESKLGRSLEEIGIPVAYVDLETPDQYSRDIATLGQILGSPARADEIRRYYEDRVDFVARTIAASDSSAVPQVLLVQHSARGGDIAFSVPASPWMQTAIVEMAGGAPVWKEAAQAGGWTVVNLEQVAAWDPDVILLVDYGGDAELAVAQLRSNPQWQELRAVRDARFFPFPADFYSWDQPDPRWILGLTWLAQKLHPASFPDLDMEEEVIDFFDRMYRLDRSTVESNILPFRGDALR